MNCLSNVKRSDTTASFDAAAAAPHDSTGFPIKKKQYTIPVDITLKVLKMVGITKIHAEIFLKIYVPGHRRRALYSAKKKVENNEIVWSSPQEFHFLNIRIKLEQPAASPHQPLFLWSSNSAAATTTAGSHPPPRVVAVASSSSVSGGSSSNHHKASTLSSMTSGTSGCVTAAGGRGGGSTRLLMMTQSKLHTEVTRASLKISVREEDQKGRIKKSGFVLINLSRYFQLRRPLHHHHHLSNQQRAPLLSVPRQPTSKQRMTACQHASQPPSSQLSNGAPHIASQSPRLTTEEGTIGEAHESEGFIQTPYKQGVAMDNALLFVLVTVTPSKLEDNWKLEQFLPTLTRQHSLPPPHPHNQQHNQQQKHHQISPPITSSSSSSEAANPDAIPVGVASFASSSFDCQQEREKEKERAHKNEEEENEEEEEQQQRSSSPPGSLRNPHHQTALRNKHSFDLASCSSLTRAHPLAHAHTRGRPNSVHRHGTNSMTQLAEAATSTNTTARMTSDARLPASQNCWPAQPPPPPPEEGTQQFRMRNTPSEFRNLSGGGGGGGGHGISSSSAAAAVRGVRVGATSFREVGGFGHCRTNSDQSHLRGAPPHFLHAHPLTHAHTQLHSQRPSALITQQPITGLPTSEEDDDTTFISARRYFNQQQQQQQQYDDNDNEREEEDNEDYGGDVMGETAAAHSKFTAYTVPRGGPDAASDVASSVAQSGGITSLTISSKQERRLHLEKERRPHPFQQQLPPPHPMQLGGGGPASHSSGYMTHSRGSSASASAFVCAGAPVCAPDQMKKQAVNEGGAFDHSAANQNTPPRPAMPHLPFE